MESVATLIIVQTSHKCAADSRNALICSNSSVPPPSRSRVTRTKRMHNERYTVIACHGKKGQFISLCARRSQVACMHKTAAAATSGAQQRAAGCT
jgi:hypothetical protein